MNEEQWKNLEPAEWAAEDSKIARGGSGLNEVDRSFLDRAHKALRQSGFGALEFIKANPGLSKIELAKLLNKGVSAIGLIMAIYEEAAKVGSVRATATDLLIRQIRDEFPNGWSIKGNVSAVVRLGSWDYEIEKYVPDPQIACYATKIVKHLALDSPPPEGWKPSLQQDVLIDDLFNIYWPIESPGKA